MFLSQISDFQWNVHSTFTNNEDLHLSVIMLRIFLEIISTECYVPYDRKIDMKKLQKYDIGKILTYSIHHRRHIIPHLLFMIQKNDFSNVPWTRFLTNFRKSKFLYCHAFYNVMNNTTYNTIIGRFIVSTENTIEYETKVFFASQGRNQRYFAKMLTNSSPSREFATAG